MEFVTTTTALGTPVGALKAKVVHLLWLHNGDDIWSLCDKRVRGHVFVREDAATDTICQDCIDERDYRDAKAAKFEHAVSYSSQRQSGSPIAGSRATYLCAQVTCRDCAMGAEKTFTVWSSNGTTVAEAKDRVRQHYISMWRAHKAAERSASPTEPAESETTMTTPNDEIPAGWVKAPVAASGSYRYTHPQYAGWKVYDAGRGGVITIYRDGDTVGEYADLPEAFAMIAENVVPDNRRVDLDGNLIRRRETISAVDHEKAVRGIAETLDPSAFDGSDPSAVWPAGHSRRDAAREIARGMLKTTGVPEPTGTVDPNRVINDDEFKALVTIETAERLAVRAHRLLAESIEGPLSNAPARIAAAQSLLSSLTAETTTRTATAVKRQDVSDRISAAARANVERIMTAVDA